MYAGSERGVRFSLCQGEGPRGRGEGPAASRQDGRALCLDIEFVHGMLREGEAAPKGETVGVQRYNVTDDMIAATLLFGLAQDVAELVRRLGDDSIQIREEAEAKLAGSEWGRIRSEIEKAIREDRDPEVRWRCRRIRFAARFSRPLSAESRREFESADGGLAKAKLALDHWGRVLDAGGAINWSDAAELLQEEIELSPDEKRELIFHISYKKFLFAGPLLVDWLKEDNPTLRRDAVVALRNLRLYKFAPQAVRCLKDPSCDVRLWTVITLRDLGSIPPNMSSLLTDEDSRVRAHAAQWIGQVGMSELAGDVAKLLQDESGLVRCMAATSLSDLGAREHLHAIAKLLGDSHYQVRSYACQALARLKAAEYVPQIGKLFRTDQASRTYSMRALGALGADAYASEIALYLSDPDGLLRGAAAEALGSMGPRAKEFGKRIARLFRDPANDVRASSYRALGKMQLMDKVDAIAQGLGDEDSDVRIAAIRFLADLKQAKYAPEIAKGLSDLTVQGDACLALADLGLKEYVPQIVQVLKGDAKPYKSYRCAALALAKLGARERAPEIAARLLKADGDWVLEGMIEALRRLACPEIVPALREVIEKKDLRPETCKQLEALLRLCERGSLR